MAVETDVPLDLGAMKLPALYINRVQVLVSGPNVRMAFGEGFSGGNTIYRSAVTMTIQDAREVAEAILATLAAPTREKTGGMSASARASAAGELPRG